MSSALIGCVISAAMALGVGYAWGRHAEVQRRVDVVLRRETRLRHPAGSRVGGVSLGALIDAERRERAERLRDAGAVSARTADLLMDGDPEVSRSVDKRLRG